MLNHQGLNSSPITQIKEIVLLFKSVTEIEKFKHECECPEFYMDRDALTLVGTFTEAQLYIATSKYSAMCKLENK